MARRVTEVAQSTLDMVSTAVDYSLGKCAGYTDARGHMFMGILSEGWACRDSLTRKLHMRRFSIRKPLNIAAVPQLHLHLRLHLLLRRL